MKQRIWLTWERQRRNRTLSEALEAHLYEFDHKLPRIRRWLKAIGGTIGVLWRERPRYLFAQNPSLVLALIAVWYGRLTGRVVAIDAHNAGIFPFFGRAGRFHRMMRPIMQRLAHYVMRKATVTIVSNPGLAGYVERVGGRAFVLPDPLPHLGSSSGADGAGDTPSVLFICTWAADEPYAEVLKAAARLDPATRIYITGNSKGREQVVQPVPDNVILTGFVPEEEFVALLHRADAVMDLTTLDNCLVCGAYEAVAASKPMVLSDTEALRAYFRKGAVFARNDADSIAGAVRQVLADKARLDAEVVALKRELLESWQQQRADLELLLSARGADAAAVESSGRS